MGGKEIHGGIRYRIRKRIKMGELGKRARVRGSA
jgi:hypothetical protein